MNLCVVCGARARSAKVNTCSSRCTQIRDSGLPLKEFNRRDAQGRINHGPPNDNYGVTMPLGGSLVSNIDYGYQKPKFIDGVEI